MSENIQPSGRSVPVRRIYVDESLETEYAAAAAVDYRRAADPVVSFAENAVVLPLKKWKNGKSENVFAGGVIDEGGCFFTPSTHIHLLDGDTGSLKSGYEFDGSAVAEDAREVIYGGILYDHFGHALVESLNRLWYVLEHPEQTAPVVFLRETDKPLCPQVADMLSLLKLDGRLIFIARPTRFAKVTVPEQSGVLTGYYTDKFLKPFDAISTTVTAKPFDKVYLSRRKFKSGIKIYGEDKLERVFKANGYHIVYPERISLKGQIAYVKGAKEIACVMGSAAHLTLFAAPKTKLIVLERTEHINREQILINQAMDLDWYSVDANLNYLPVGHEFSPMLLGITDSAAEFFRDHGMHFDEREINRVSDRAVRRFCRAFFARYSSNKYNAQISGLAPVCAKRIGVCCKTAFLSLRERLFRKQTDGEFRVFTVFGFTFRKKRKR